MTDIRRNGEDSDMSRKSRFFVRQSEVTPYSPLNHTGTINRRLIGPEETGSKNLEVLLGVVSKPHGALPHSHPGIDQVCYLIEGRAIADIGGEREELGPGDACFFPANMPHTFTAVSEEPVKVLVIYTPPYGEKGRGHPRLGVSQDASFCAHGRP
jgi:mannose-6-phosphate isomerase-like protein (cupin superfamily)